MTLVGSTTLPLGRAAREPFTATLSPGFSSELAVWSRMTEDGAALAFQRAAWLAPWCAAIAPAQELECLAVTVHDALGHPVMGLPLVRQRLGLTRIGFADGGLADFNAPILSRRVGGDPAAARAMWAAIRRVLPYADVIRLERMPLEVDGIVNPLALLPAARPARECGLVLDVPDSYEAWRQALPRRYRMELGRCDRLFEALPGARFERVTSGGPDVYAALERLQRRRIKELGIRYTLDDHDVGGFYRSLAEDLERGPGVLTALRTEAGVIAALFGLRHGRRYTMLRIGAAAEHARMSPARALITRTIEALRADGVDTFDFGRGDYTYKRKMGGRPLALHDLVLARTPLGMAEASGFRLRAHLRNAPRLHAAAKRLRGAVLGSHGEKSKS